VNEGWEKKFLGDVATLQRGFDLPHRLRKEGEIPIVTSSGMEATHSESRVSAPGVVTGRYGTIGQVFFIDRDFWPLNTTLYVRDFHNNDPLFISYLLKTIDFHSHSGKSGVPGVNRNDLHELIVAIPPNRTEQTAIATALSDADALIESLEKLIHKKRQIKQGAMQELLTGKKRLPGFVGEWEVRRLGEVCDFVNGKPYEDFVVSGGRYQLITLDSISISGQLKSEHRTVDFSDGSLRKGDIVCVLSDIAHAKLLGLGDVIPKDDNYVLNQRMGRLRCYDGFDPYFVRLQINRNQEFFRMRGQGSSQKHIYKKDFYELEINIPNLTEQTAIATILSDMDAGLAALEDKLVKAKAVKQGMMQELLTGRVRLV
jgi:type I restriction enzyme S subunit